MFYSLRKSFSIFILLIVSHLTVQTSSPEFQGAAFTHKTGSGHGRFALLHSVWRRHQVFVFKIEIWLSPSPTGVGWVSSLWSFSSCLPWEHSRILGHLSQPTCLWSLACDATGCKLTKPMKLFLIDHLTLMGGGNHRSPPKSPFVM